MWKRKLGIGMGIGMLLAASFLIDRDISVFVSKVVKGQKVIVLDSGHGGNDPGKVGVGGALEKDINLSIAKKVKGTLEKKNYCVVMTREEDKGLYQETDNNKKMADLQARVKLIDEVNPELVVSIHQNSFGSSEVKGAQVFYYTDSQEGKRIGDIMQETIKSVIADGNHRLAKGNKDYYLLRNTKAPIVIVECGFLSNPEEESLLKSEEYQNKMAEAIVAGIEKSLNGNDTPKNLP